MGKTRWRLHSGRQLKLGEYDGMVREYIHALRLAARIVNRTIIVAAATGILLCLSVAENVPIQYFCRPVGSG